MIPERQDTNEVKLLLQCIVWRPFPGLALRGETGIAWQSSRIENIGVGVDRQLEL